MIKIVKPDGNSAETPVYFSTGVQTIYIKGLISTEINHVTIEYLGNKFSDPDDVYVGEGEFTFPNPNSFSEGIDLSTGLNVFKVSAFKDDISYGLLELNVIFSADVVGLVNPPSGIIVSRSSNSVEVSFDHLDSEVVYYNIYASALSGGVVSNYFKINHEPLSPNKYGSREEIVNALKETSTDISLEDEDPLFLETTSTQKDHSDVVLSSQTLNTFEVAETVKRIRISSTFQSIALKTRVAFRHVRNASLISTPPTISVGALSSVSSNKPLYYVVTSVKVIAGVEIESPLSVEVSGMPIQVTNTTLSLPVVGRDQMATDMIQSIFLSQPNIAIQAGSVVRDIIIDPFLSEMERVRFLLDFCYRSSSFSGLLSIDDPLNEGSSISVVESQYKTVLTQALFVQEDEVQVFIDSAFEKLASNFGVRRSIGKQATGEVSFFTTNAPSSSISIPAGTVLSSSTTNFITTLSVVLNVDQLSQYYNPTTKKYSIVVPVQARDAGVSGNLTSDQITKGSPFGLKVTNQAPTFGGTDTETNSELASRAISVLSSVDISTKAGLERVSREISGIINSFVVDSESPYMQRDDELGGKVDIWIRGESLATVSDVYAPSYQSYFESRFIPVSSPNAYIFRNMEATIETPLSEMINRGSLGYGLRNLTTNQTFDLTNVVILDYRTIQLDSSISQPTYSVADNIIGEWRSGITNKIILKRQPVREIKSVSYADGTAISDYSFYDNEDALQLGRSSGSSNYVLIPNNTERNKILIIEDESHTIIGFYPERLNNLGVDQLSLVVTDVAGTTIYKSPFLSQSADYIISKDENDNCYIQRTSDSAIKDGDIIHISYEYLENIVVNYDINLVVNNTQTGVDGNKNIFADIVVKEAIGCSVDVKATVVLDRGVDSTLVDSEIRYSLTSFINESSLGGSIRHSEIVTVLNNVDGVNHIILPLTQMSFAQDTYILRETISLSASGFNRVASLSNSRVNVYSIDSELLNKTQDLGGLRGRVFIGKEEMGILDTLDRNNASSWGHKVATIVNDVGLGIEGVKTNNRILFALNIGESPSDYTYYVDYNVEGTIETVSELKLNGFSFFKTGSLAFTYEEVQ